MVEAKVLLIDDDEVLLELLSDHINAAGYRSLVAISGQEGLRLAAETEPDLVVLDVMMPGMDGWEVCRRLREISPMPIIMLTAKRQEVDKLRGFRLGVDDYMTKPFSFAELVARINAVLSRLRRAAPETRQVISDDLIIDFTQRRVTVSGQVVELSSTEYRLLETLAHFAHRPVHTEKLLSDVWGPEYAGEVDRVKHYIWALRKKVEADPGDPQHILTERGFGYRFE